MFAKSLLWMDRQVGLSPIFQALMVGKFPLLILG